MSSVPQRTAATAYLEQEIRTADPVALIAIVFEVALAQAARARAALAASDFRSKGMAVDRLTRCLGVLQSSLDMDRGGAAAANFDRVYRYLLTRVMEGHAHNDDEAFGEVAKHLGELASAWREACAVQNR